MNLLIKGGTIISPKDNIRFIKKDILIKDGKIEKIADEINSLDVEVLDADGMYVSAGFIDVHTHCYNGKSPIGTEADSIGIEKGCTTIFDAGTAGPLNYEDFKKNHIDKCKTDIYSLLNVSDYGLETLNELIDLSKINYEVLEKVVKENSDRIKGIKVRASKSVVGENGIKPIEIAKSISTKLGLSLTVHIGNYPPHIDEVIDLLDEGDIVTHAYHGKVNGIFNEDGLLRNSILQAKNRGVLFDVGHGSESFSFDIFKKAMNQGLKPDLISTDMYNRNMNGPVHSLLSVVNKVMELGISLEECIEKVTSYPAEVFNLSKSHGRIIKGEACSFTIFEMEDNNEVLKDSIGNELNISRKLNLKYTVMSRGKEIEIYRSCQK